MLVEKAYRPGALSCAATDSLPEVARKMAAEHVGALAVLDGNVLVGVISERDLARAVARDADLPETTAITYASRDVLTAGLTEDTSQVARRMLDAGIRHLPVVRDKIVVGVLSMRDLLALETWL
jgi:CBS domain-containing protein